MKKYVVKGKDLKELLSKVAKHFEVDISKVKYEVLRKTPEFEVKVWKEDDVSHIKQNFKIELRDEGIFLEVTEIEDSKGLTLKNILKDIENRKIKDVDIVAVEESLYKLGTPIRIASFDKEYYIDSVATIEILNNMEATIKISEPKRGRDVTVEQVLQLAQEKGIIIGLRKKSINTMIQEKIYNKKVILAKGKDVIHGVNAIIKNTFEKEEKIVDKTKKDTKSSDFIELNWILNTTENEVLSEKIPGVPGVDGIDIFGKVIVSKEPKDVKLVAGKNTFVSDDGLYLRSKINGQIIKKNKSISVEPVLNINGNVDYTTGNIDYIGTVIVKGNVLSGFSIKAGEDIFIEGLVEDCDLHSGGKIVVTNGILGNEDFHKSIYAKEGIQALFIQHMKIRTNGSVEVVKHILHSSVEARDKVLVTSGTGKIIGGEVKAQNGIECNIAGGPFETPTKLVLDVYNEVIKEESELNKEILILEENKYKVEKLLKDTEAIKDQLSEETKLKREEAVKQLIAINNMYVVLESKRNDIEEERQLIKSKEIKVLQKIYPGVIIKIVREIYLNRQEKIRTDFFIDKETNEIKER